MQASFDNGNNFNGVEPLLINPKGGNVGIGTIYPQYRISFAYFPQYNLVYLDGPNGGSTLECRIIRGWRGGSDLSNGDSPYMQAGRRRRWKNPDLVVHFTWAVRDRIPSVIYVAAKEAYLHGYPGRSAPG